MQITNIVNKPKPVNINTRDTWVLGLFGPVKLKKRQIKALRKIYKKLIKLCGDEKMVFDSNSAFARELNDFLRKKYANKEALERNKEAFMDHFIFEQKPLGKFLQFCTWNGALNRDYILVLLLFVSVFTEIKPLFLWLLKILTSVSQ